LKSEAEWSQIRLGITVSILCEPKQTELGNALVKGMYLKDPFVAKVLDFYGVAI